MTLPRLGVAYNFLPALPIERLATAFLVLPHFPFGGCSTTFGGGLSGAFREQRSANVQKDAGEVLLCFLDDLEQESTRDEVRTAFALLYKSQYLTKRSSRA